MSISEKINYYLGKIIVYMLCIVYPFVMHDKLNDVTITRFMYFIIVSYVGCAVMIINWGINWIINTIKNRADNKDITELNDMHDDKQNEKADIKTAFACLLSDIRIRIKKADTWKKLILLFLFVCLMSYICSPYKNVALMGAGGRYTGLVFYGACVCMYSVVSNCYRFEKRDITYMLCSSIIVNIWAMLNYTGFDPFYLYRDVPIAMKEVYISPLGNIDIYGMYVTMMLAVSMFAFIYEENIAGKVFYGFTALLSMMGILVSNSDMAVAGMFFAFVILAYFAVSDYSRLIRYFTMAIMVFIAGRILGIIYILNPFNTRIIRSVGSIIIYKNIFILFPVLCFAAILIIQIADNKYKIFDNKPLINRIKNIYAIACASLVAVVCVLGILCTVIGRGPLAISDEWGSGRGYIWKNVLNGYHKLPFINKIFGAGEATTAWILSDYSDAANNILNRGRVDNAHNIWINMLVTIGIAGLIVYTAIVVLAIRNMLNCIKKSAIEADNIYKSKYMLAAFGIGVMVYSIQGTAEMLEVITFPIFFCMVAMLNAAKHMGNRRI